MRHQLATVHELARIAELGGLPGEKLTRLAERMERQELAPGERVDAEGRVVAVFAGLLRGPAGVLRPGQTISSGTATAVTPSTVAACSRADYEALVT
jgi:hypothetical protein